jgi:hypothetical protein
VTCGDFIPPDQRRAKSLRDEHVEQRHIQTSDRNQPEIRRPEPGETANTTTPVPIRETRSIPDQVTPASTAARWSSVAAQTHKSLAIRDVVSTFRKIPATQIERTIPGTFHRTGALQRDLVRL